MKKFALISAFALSLSLNAYAETYHGIDIDKVYSQSDWSSKDKIKEIIDDYSLLLQYNNELKQCSEQANQFDCINNLTQNIMQHFYSHNYENNISDYQNYVESTFTIYGIAYCLNKYNTPSGTVCEQEKNAHINKLMKQYTETLLSQIEKQINVFSFIKDYE